MEDIITVDNLIFEYTDEDTYFFLCGEPLQQDMGTILSFPDLAHA